MGREPATPTALTAGTSVAVRDGCWVVSTIRRVSADFGRDVGAVRERDPAAEGVSTLEICHGRPGLHALLTHRVAHALDAVQRAALAARALAVPLARADRDRDPPGGATIGDGLFIDHGMGC